MSKTVWLITGAGRGMGTDIAKAALAAGHAVVATGRDPERVAAAIGAHDDLLAVKLDVTNPDDAKAAAGAGGQDHTAALTRRGPQQVFGGASPWHAKYRTSP
jgi:NAD(P)-dependent dehydrogenase (short-subunit alcohol dehydrogenase family)